MNVVNIDGREGLPSNVINDNITVMSAPSPGERRLVATPGPDPWVRATGVALIATGVLHVAFGLAIAADPLRLLLNGGVVGAAPVNPILESWFWYMVAGIPLLLVGQLVRQSGRTSGRVPGVAIPYLLVLGVLVVLYPVSGLWLFFVDAGIAAVAWSRGRSARPTSTADYALRRRASDAAL